MIGISGRCASGARAPPAASTPSPSTPAHVEGARVAFKRKTGCYVVAEPRALGGPLDYAMGVFNPCLVTDGTEGAASSIRASIAATNPCSSSRRFAPGSGPRRRRGRSKSCPRGRPECRDRVCETNAIAKRPNNAARRQRAKAVRDLRWSPRTSGRSGLSRGSRGSVRSSLGA